MDLRARASRIGALADDTRRRLYEYVAAQTAPVTRDQASEALDIAPHTAYFHLDKLVTEGLLDVENRRLTGRTGPGAGRPSKLYRRADGELTVSLPPRQYDVVGDILATAVVRARAGAPLASALDETAHERGAEIAGATDAAALPRLEGVAHVLASLGYEPRLEGDRLDLANCPFDTLAEKHTELVCGLNRSFVQGVGDGLGGGVAACLEPAEGQCCVRVRSSSSAPGSPTPGT